MKCDRCKTESNEVVPLLSHFHNGKPVFRNHCKICEKTILEEMKTYLIDAEVYG